MKWFKKKMAEEAKKEAEKSEETAAAAAGSDETGKAGGTGETGEPGKTGESSESGKPGEAGKPGESGETGKAGEPAAAEPDWKDLYARLRADFDNYKKRAARERDDIFRYSEAEILKDILPTVDNLALALSNATVAAPAPSADAPAAAGDAFVKGVRLVYDTLLAALKQHGAEPFDALGQKLDVEKMEAIATLPSPDYDEGLVSNEVKRGWLLKGRVLRAAQVVVSSGKPGETDGK